MENILPNPAEEPIAVSASAVRKLIRRQDSGDAALLYLALLRHRGTVPPRALARELRWERTRLEGAEQVLRELELIAPAKNVEPADETPDYQQSDIAMRLEESEEFRDLTAQVEQLLGKKLTTPEVGTLLGLYDHLGFPAHIIYQLVNHCVRKTTARYGEGRRPFMWYIEREGYVWARLNLFSQPAVDAYLKRQSVRADNYAPLMQVLQLGDRSPVESEEKYLNEWLDMGFPLETVALAYDRTVLNCHEFKWAYCNNILKRWHEAGVHTPAEVQERDHPAPQKKKRPSVSAATSDEIRKYVQEQNRDRR